MKILGDIIQKTPDIMGIVESSFSFSESLPLINANTFGSAARSQLGTADMLWNSSIVTGDWTLTSHEQSRASKANRSSMVLKEKFTPEDEFLNLKSRLAADGDQQDRAL